jgi:hypothetical protein
LKLRAVLFGSVSDSLRIFSTARRIHFYAWSTLQCFSAVPSFVLVARFRIPREQVPDFGSRCVRGATAGLV